MARDLATSVESVVSRAAESLPRSVRSSRGLDSVACSVGLAAFTALLLAWPAAAAAQGEVRAGGEPADAADRGAGWMRFELGFYAGAFMADDQHEFYDWRIATQEPLEPVGPEVGVRAAFFPFRFLGIEGEADILPHATESGDGVLLFGGRGHLILQVPARVTPFLLGGFGIMGIQSDEDALGSDIDAVGHLGLGVKFRLSERGALRVDGRVLRAPQAGSEGGTNHFAVLLGGAFTFGGAGGPKPSAPPPSAPRTEPVPVAAKVEPPPPPTDGDGDGVPDGPVGPDYCPEQPEDRDGFEDEDGCPDSDNDGDQVDDASDRCPLEAGVADNLGCPDSDRDGDSVVDRFDNCPEQAGTVEDQGCTDRQRVVIAPDRLRLLEPVTFTTNRSKIRRRSRRVLDNVAAVLLSHPALSRIRIAGHTDERGDMDENRELSLRRAEMVKKYLIGRCIVADRLEVIGYGEERPLEANTSAAGRASNRRVEFEIAERSAP